MKKIWQEESIKTIKHTDSEGKRHITEHAGGNGSVDGADIVFSSISKLVDYHENTITEIFM